MSMNLIPKGLPLPEIQIYKKLIRVAQRRKKRRQRPRPIVVITDVGKDYDDVAALLVLKELHRLGLVELRAVVANLMPADKRAYFTRLVLDSLDLGDVPVASGTRGSPDEHEEFSHEFNLSGFDRFVEKLPEYQYESSKRDGQELLHDVYLEAQAKGEKLYLLCISSLQDINEFASKNLDLVANNTAEVYMQGCNYISKEGDLEPDCDAANNRFNFEAARGWHSFIQRNAIPSHTYTKAAAFAAPLVSNVFMELESTGHPIGAYLRRVQVKQDLTFYERACNIDPTKRFAPFMDQEWFLANKTDWYQQPHRQGDALPTGKEVIPFLTKLVLYDALPAVGVAGEDVVTELKFFQGKDRCVRANRKGRMVDVRHRIYSGDWSKVIPNEADGVKVALSALLKGSLLAVQKGLSSENNIMFQPHQSLKGRRQEGELQRGSSFLNTRTGFVALYWLCAQGRAFVMGCPDHQQL